MTRKLFAVFASIVCLLSVAMFASAKAVHIDQNGFTQNVNDVLIPAAIPAPLREPGFIPLDTDDCPTGAIEIDATTADFTERNADGESFVIRFEIVLIPTKDPISSESDGEHICDECTARERREKISRFVKRSSEIIENLSNKLRQRTESASLTQSP